MSPLKNLHTEVPMLKLSGKDVAQAKREEIRLQVKNFRDNYGRRPGLAVVLVGEDPASQVYVRNKGLACAEVGIESFEYKLAESTDKLELKKLIESLNQEEKVDGILVQLPLPKHLNGDEALAWIDPHKDPDGLTVENMGLLFTGQPRVKSCTPAGVMEILKFYNIDVAGKNAVVVGRSNIVGKPMAQLLQQANATVGVCHSRTQNTQEYTKRADIVVVAAGQPRFMGREFFKKGSVVIDVGMHRDENNKLCGDVRFEELEGWVSAATPVPGGVGPMTITMLLANTLKLAKDRCH